MKQMVIMQKLKNVMIQLSQLKIVVIVEVVSQEIDIKGEKR